MEESAMSSATPRLRPSLAQLFLGAALASVLLVAIGLALFLRSSRQAALDAAAHSRQVEAQRVEARVALALGTAQDALDDVERAIASGAVKADDARALEALLYTRLLGSRHVAEVSFTRARLVRAGTEPDELEFDPDERWQLSVFTMPDGSVATRRTASGEQGFMVQQWVRQGGSQRFDVVGSAQTWTAPDPTLHPTFRVSAAAGPGNGPIWSDLHFSELDAGSPAPRVVLTVQKGVWDGAGAFLGVARVGLLTTDLDAISELGSEPRLAVAGSEPAARVALLAVSADETAPARLVARVDPEDSVVAIADELRIAPAHAPPEVAALLDSPLVRGLDPERPSREGRLRIGDEDWLATLSALSIAGGGTAGWLVAVLVPETHYTRDLVELGRLLSLVFGATLLLVLGIAGAVFYTVRRGLLRVGETAARMRQFDFRGSSAEGALRDVVELLESLELAKTVTRAMCKYIPVPLVRRLYERHRDPELGGELCEVSLLFTDIQGFTALSERLTPDQLARYLGRYFEVMTGALEAHGATIDKYIGDAVMAFWNAPAFVPEHPLAACRGVLAAQAALAELYGSPEWQGLPPLVTRFGLHRASVMVGHFGAPSRLAYTALGDGVNLTSRLEGLCKQYGVTTLVSGSIAESVQARLGLRHIDRVVVKGKREAVDVYELLGSGPLADERLALVQGYEAAWQAYRRREFGRAQALLTPLAHLDSPSRVLWQRCQSFLLAPPPADWTGVHLAPGK
jgi:adenylate cyclase